MKNKEDETKVDQDLGMCGDCMKKKYGEPKREMGAITVSPGVCPVCNYRTIIVPSLDIYHAYSSQVNTENWD